jgi:hypothetical protein
MNPLLPHDLTRQFINAAIVDDCDTIATIFQTTNNPNLLFYAIDFKLDSRLTSYPPLISVLCFFAAIRSVHLLLEHGCNVYALDSMNRSVLHFIAMSNSLVLWHEFEQYYDSQSYDYDLFNPFGYSLIYNSMSLHGR